MNFLGPIIDDVGLEKIGSIRFHLLFQSFKKEKIIIAKIKEFAKKLNKRFEEKVKDIGLKERKYETLELEKIQKWKKASKKKEVKDFKNLNKTSF